MLTVSKPTNEQLAVINSFIPPGMEELTADEVLSVPFVASNNLISWSGGVWSLQALTQMGEKFPGRQLMFDHPWGSWLGRDSSRDTFGFVYDAELIHSNAAPSQLLDLGNGEVNRQIVARDGYNQLILYGAIAKDNPIVQDMRFRRHADVSTGSLTDGHYTCPLCNHHFDDKHCPHYPPGFEWYLSEDEQDLVAPYYIRDTVVYSVELSFVPLGNLPGARIIENWLNSFLEEAVA